MSTIKRVYALLSKAERRSAVLLLGLMVIGMGLETLGIGAVVPAVALLTQEDLSVAYPELRPVLVALGNPTQGQLVIYGMLSLVGIYLIKTLFLAFLAWRQTKFAFGLQARLSQRLFETYLRQPYTFHLQRNSAQLISNAITEAAHVTSNAITPAMTLLAEALVLVGIAGLLLAAEPLGAVIVVVVLATATITFQRVIRVRIPRWGAERQHHDRLRIQHLQQGLGGAKDVKLLGRENGFLASYGLHNSLSARVAQRQATLIQLPRLWLEMLGVAGLATLIVTMVAQGHSMHTIMPTLALFAVAAFRLMPSTTRVLGAMQSLRYGMPAISTVHEELSLPVHQPSTGAPAVLGFRKEIALCNVSYTYPGAPAPSLHNVSIRVQGGESVGFVGPSGSGKSTLVDVVLGLLAPTAGQVLVDGQDIQQDLRSWQDQIGYVPQSIFLTDDTLRGNVAFGLPDGEIDESAVWRAIRAAQLEEFVASHPDGLNCMVGERGVRLSGGQRQRIGIARALYHDPPVLVLDEATSALDLQTEREVMGAVAALQSSKTILIVAHRLATVENCDRLYRLEGGRIAREGAPTEMLGV